MATGTPLVSVVMPNYNNEEFLPDAIKSIQQQTLKDYELVIYHDPSEDSSLQVLQDFSSKDTRINLILGTKKQGCFHAYNMAINHARGKYIFVMDSDNIMAPELLQKSLDMMNANSEITMLSSVHRAFSKHKRISKRKQVIKKPYHHDLVAVKLLNSCCFANAMMVRREFFDNTGLRYDENLHVAADYKLFLEALLQNEYPVKFAFINYLGIHYRYHDDNLSRRSDLAEKRLADKIAIGNYVSEKLYHPGDNYEILRSIALCNMNPRYMKSGGLIRTDQVTINNLLLWRDATMEGLNKYHNLDARIVRAHLNYRILSIIFAKLKNRLKASSH